MERVSIGEIWLAPRVLSEFDEDLCDDAQVFKDETQRRIKQARRGITDSGDRVRIIGYADILDEDDYEGFPEEMLTVPGNAITEIDGEELSSSFRAFVHAPFKDDAEAERRTSNEGASCRALLRSQHRLLQVTLEDYYVTRMCLDEKLMSCRAQVRSQSRLEFGDLSNSFATQERRKHLNRIFSVSESVQVPECTRSLEWNDYCSQQSHSLIIKAMPARIEDTDGRRPEKGDERAMFLMADGARERE